MQEERRRADRLAGKRENARFQERLRADLESRINPDYIEYIEGIKDKDTESTILIEIPAFLEKELLLTIESARANAAFPGRVHFAVCVQDDDRRILEALDQVPNCKYKHYSVQDAPGTCAARYEASLLYDGEDYVFHTDGHMRFARYWDLSMIEQWERCRDPRAVVSAYALSYTALQDPADDDYTKRAEMKCIRMFTDGFCWNMWQFGRNGCLGAGRQDEMWPGAVISAHNLFMKPEADTECPVDPNTFFSADEILMSVRLFTHGFNIYNPVVQCVYHRYRATPELLAAPQFIPDKARKRKQEDQETAIALQLLGIIPMGPKMKNYGFGLGKARTLDDYVAFSGIDFKHQLMKKFSSKGDFRLPHDDRDAWNDHWDPATRWNDGNSDPFTVRITRYLAGRMADYVNANKSSVSAVVNLALTYYFSEMDRTDMPTFLNGLRSGTEDEKDGKPEDRPEGE